MHYAIRAKATFDTTHQAKYPERCNMLHGHTFTVQATVSHELMDDGIPRGSNMLEETLSAIASELDERPMDQMIPGVEKTLTGLAAFIFERLAADYPGLERVEVYDGYSTGVVISR